MKKKVMSIAILTIMIFCLFGCGSSAFGGNIVDKFLNGHSWEETSNEGHSLGWDNIDLYGYTSEIYEPGYGETLESIHYRFDFSEKNDAYNMFDKMNEELEKKTDFFETQEVSGQEIIYYYIGSVRFMVFLSKDYYVDDYSVYIYVNNDRQ